MITVTLTRAELEEQQGLRVRFAAKVDISGPCWEWTGAVSGRGYGQIKVRRRIAQAHRTSYELAHGPIRGGLLVCHRCDNRRCVRPSHLFLGTNADNVRDCIAKRRHGAAVHPETVRRGQAHHSAKLTDGDVLAARAAHRDGESARSLARFYGVSSVAMDNALAGRTWRHLERET